MKGKEMTDIYQEIWDVDQKNAGLKPIKKGTQITPELKQHGYVEVDEKANMTKNHILIHSPEFSDKRSSYDNVLVLFNNYTLDDRKPENVTQAEREEVQHFIETIYLTDPMRAARDYISHLTGEQFSDNEWWAVIERIWFDMFQAGNKPDGEWF